MSVLQIDNFESIRVEQGQAIQLVDIFTVSGKKTIELSSHTSLIYLIVGTTSDIDIEIITTWPNCSCKIFGLFPADAKHPVTGSLKVALKHAYTSADVELISFLRDGANVAIDGSIAIDPLLDTVHGRLLEHNIVLWKDISVKTFPKLNIASHNVRASHGANIDSLDPQKLFYMMSRGLTQEQSQKLLVDGYVEYVLQHFEECRIQNSECRKQIECMI